MSGVVIADLPVDERPRERMARHGAASLSDAELLAVLISPGRRGQSAIDLAREVLRDGLQSLVRREWIPGRRTNGLGSTQTARLAAALELSRRIAMLPAGSRDPLSDLSSIGPGLVARYGHEVQEHLGGIYLDSRRRIIREREIFVGTLDSAIVSPRDVLRLAFEEHAASVIIFHNHPSGDPTPSADDIIFTRRLIEGGATMGIEIVDHLILASTRWVSMKQRGMM